jgi:hypothetical protein
MKIPYAALRFGNAPKQTWDWTFMREIKRDVQKIHLESCQLKLALWVILKQENSKA